MIEAEEQRLKERDAAKKARQEQADQKAEAKSNKA
jgi:hypothetical protein